MSFTTFKSPVRHMWQMATRLGNAGLETYSFLYLLYISVNKSWAKTEKPRKNRGKKKRGKTHSPTFICCLANFIIFSRKISFFPQSHLRFLTTQIAQREFVSNDISNLESMQHDLNRLYCGYTHPDWNWNCKQLILTKTEAKSDSYIILNLFDH